VGHALETLLLPSASAYVGADIVGGVLASGLLYDEGPSLLVDIGTNGEIVLKHGDQLIAAATAAGPAFEGHGLQSGLRATHGAIDTVRLNSQPSTDPIGKPVSYTTIAETRAMGVCGSGYIDFLAQGVASGIVNRAGRFNEDSNHALASHVLQANVDPDMPRDDRYKGATCLRHSKLFLLTKYHGEEVGVTESDMATLLQAKGAIAAGILTLLDNFKIKPSEVKRLYLAGGFGMHLNIPHAIAMGLLPGFTPEQVQPMGNTSLAAAYLCLIDRYLVDVLETTRQNMETIELNLDPRFEDHYIDCLSLPDTDPELISN